MIKQMKQYIRRIDKEKSAIRLSSIHEEVERSLDAGRVTEDEAATIYFHEQEKRTQLSLK